MGAITLDALDKIVEDYYREIISSCISPYWLKTRLPFSDWLLQGKKIKKKVDFGVVNKGMADKHSLLCNLHDYAVIVILLISILLIKTYSKKERKYRP